MSEQAFETVIGLEVHVQLATASKMFCGSSAAFGGEPNEFIDPVTLGLPGALPVTNKRAVEFAIMLGLAMNCEIRQFNRFARKHYFYPDLPKGYQISQFDEPICERGSIKVLIGDTLRTIGITRIHLEEDAGKNIHDIRTESSLIDLNRAGVPLLEIVSEPDLRSPSEASAYMKKVRQIVRYLGVSDGNMDEGSLRCDANVSLRPVGEMKFGTRAEIKNINSFKFVEKALEYEVARQTALLMKGERVVQETRLFDPESGTTRPMRGKEESSDYRYFPDPDLPPLNISESRIAEIRSTMPKLPDEKFRELVDTYRLSEYDAGVLTSERSYVDFFERTFAVCSNAKASCNWVTSELFGLLKKENLEIEQSPVTPERIGELVKLIDQDLISGKMAKMVFEEMFSTGDSPQQIVERRGFKQITNPEELRQVVVNVLSENQKQLEAYLGGNENLLGFFVGQVMKATSGSANPKLVNQIIGEEIKKREK